MTGGAGTPFVFAFGDSLTAGYGLRREEAFPARLEILLQHTAPAAQVWNAGVSGDTTTSGRARLPRVLASLTARPDLAIVELGANDMLRGQDPVRMRDNLDWIVAELGRCSIPVLLAGMVAPPFLGDTARRFNAVHPDVADRHAVPLYPSFLAGVAGRNGYTLADRVHPNAKAIEVVARSILPHVQAALIATARAAA
ncbi:arylesterase [Sphingomonas glacialis]|uniref:Arylesterase n=1 Tax=Sphingomonas glacialis TaxID=658225 RepID=A0A502FRL9_9SPHN|nr:arylesterase [Sphingomonas glacialis]TPG52049.1 arylesterase [Sphingomonas glacialis]